MNNKRVNPGVTRVIYEDDAYAKECRATVVECKEIVRNADGKEETVYGIVLDATVFFPEGGGQPADEGVIGEAPVLDVQKENGKIYHYVKKPFVPGEEVDMLLDFSVRYRRMQNHTGEHVFCGLVHKLYGYENVGFHMSQDCVTVDVNGSLTAEDFEKLELLANAAIRANVPVYALYPETPEEMDYRSKLELTEDIRVVVIEGYDACACCAPHVKSTAEIGLIKVMDFMSHRGGTRFTLKCGGAALEDYVLLHEEVKQIMRLFSAKREECHLAAERVSEQLKAQQETIVSLKKQITDLHMIRLHETVKNDPEAPVIFIFDEMLDEAQMRTLVNEGVAMAPGVIAGFMGKDREGYRYIIGRKDEATEPSLRELAKEMNAALNGRGGGSLKMIQGSVTASRKEIEEFLKKLV